MTFLILKREFIDTFKGFKQVLPIIFGVVMLVSWSIVVIPKNFYTSIFSGNKFTDPLFGAIFGSVASGSPITSYIIGGELLSQGVSLVAVTAFILAWVSVGLIQLPAESILLGKRFAITRNIISFVSALIIALLTMITLMFL